MANLSRWEFLQMWENWKIATGSETIQNLHLMCAFLEAKEVELPFHQFGTNILVPDNLKRRADMLLGPHRRTLVEAWFIKSGIPWRR